MKLFDLIENNWKKVLREEESKKYFLELEKFLEEEYKNSEIYPPKKEILRALNDVDIEDVRVVILGQDPYHNENQANGLAFSVNDGVKIPPSLVNIFKELKNDLNIEKSGGDLSSWSKQGVLLLNTVLTVRKGEANSHKNKGWEIFTDEIIKKIDEEKTGVIFVLWGNESRKKKKLIDDKRNFIIEGAHPSPLSAYRGFFGGKFFSKINSYLEKKIDWN